MGTRASATFTVKAWDEKPIVQTDGGGKLTRASVAGSYTGEIEGEATSDMVMCYRADGTAEYVGLERIVGRIGGRAGSFVLRSTGAFDGSEAKANFSVVMGSGTGELTGLQGEGQFAAPHGNQGKLQLDYRLA
jgi:hypothetical protein